MKHTIRDILIHFISISGIAYVYRTIQRKKGPLVRVLCFHDVPDRVWFASVLRLLVEKHHVITPQQFHNKEFDEEKINILLTFDDGYQSWIDNCLPELQKHDIKGLFFINSGLLDIADNHEAVAHFMRNRLMISPKAPLMWSGAQALVSAGHTIGGHTVTHTSLAQLPTNEVFKEVSEDKQRIEEKLNIQIQDFAYPFGTKQDYSEKTIQEVFLSGYTYQYSAVSGFVSSKKISCIPRTLIEKQQRASQIKRWVQGGYDLFRLLHFFNN